MNDLVDYVNSNDFSWKAGLHHRFEGMTLAEMRSGTRSSSHSLAQKNLGQLQSDAENLSEAEELEQADQILTDANFRAAQ